MQHDVFETLRVRRARPTRSKISKTTPCKVASQLRGASGNVKTFDTTGKNQRQNSMFALHGSMQARTPARASSVEGRQPLKPEVDAAILDLQAFKVSPYYQTDFRGVAHSDGITAEIRERPIS